MTQVHHIRKMYYEEGRTISDISRITGHDRKTIRAKLQKEDWNKNIPRVENQEALYPSLEPYKSTIIGWLEKDRLNKPKQRHTAKKVHRRLKEELPKTFTLSYRTVAGFVAHEKKRIFGDQAQPSLPLEHIPGEAQVDFGDADFYRNEKRVSGNHLNLSFPYSNQGYTQLFQGENQQCLFEGLKAIFAHIGGIPHRIWFDNASTMVSRVLKEGKRDLTDDFLRFQAHYGFEAAFCNTNSGHEKGSVENKVGYHRRNLLVPVPHLQNLEDFNRKLLQECDDDAKRDHYRKDADISTLHQLDRQALLPMPAVDLDVSRYQTIRTNAYGKFFLYKGMHEYSTSPRQASRQVLIRLTSEHVIILDDSHREIVRHSRLYGEHKQSSMQWLPYLNQLARSPGALKYTGIYPLLPLALQNYLAGCTKGQIGGVLKAIAALTERDCFDSAVKTVETALIHQAYDPDSLMALYSRLSGKAAELPPLALDHHIPKLSPLISNLPMYDRILLRGEDK